MKCICVRGNYNNIHYFFSYCRTMLRAGVHLVFIGCLVASGTMGRNDSSSCTGLQKHDTFNTPCTFSVSHPPVSSAQQKCCKYLITHMQACASIHKHINTCEAQTPSCIHVCTQGRKQIHKHNDGLLQPKWWVAAET